MSDCVRLFDLKTGDELAAVPQSNFTIAFQKDGALNTLGMVYYRLGEYARATDTLERSLRESGGESAAFDLLFLAMCHARTGAADKARSCYDQAVQWVQQNSNKINLGPHWSEDLKAFQAEAEAVPAQNRTN